jgi:hypothetical protein
MRKNKGHVPVIPVGVAWDDRIFKNSRPWVFDRNLNFFTVVRLFKEFKNFHDRWFLWNCLKIPCPLPKITPSEISTHIPRIRTKHKFLAWQYIFKVLAFKQFSKNRSPTEETRWINQIWSITSSVQSRRYFVRSTDSSVGSSKPPLITRYIFLPE